MDCARASLLVACCGVLLCGCGAPHVGALAAGDPNRQLVNPSRLRPIDPDEPVERLGPPRGKVTRLVVDFVSLPETRTTDAKTPVVSSAIRVRSQGEHFDRLFVDAPNDLIGTVTSGELFFHTLVRPVEAEDSPCGTTGKPAARFRAIRRGGWTRDHVEYLDVSGRLARDGVSPTVCTLEPERQRRLEAKAVVPGLVYAGRGPDERGGDRERLVLILPDTIWVAAAPVVPGGGVVNHGVFTLVELPVERTGVASVVAHIPERSLVAWLAWRQGEDDVWPDPALIPSEPQTTVVVDVTWGHAAPAPTVVVRVTAPENTATPPERGP